jgi:hypothetical protein
MIGRPDVNAWAVRTRHFHAREQSEDSHACAIEAMHLANHLASLSPERRAQLNRELNS